MPLVIEPQSSPSGCCNLEHTSGYAVCRISLIGGCHLMPFMYQWYRRLLHLLFHVVWGCEISFSYYLLTIFFSLYTSTNSAICSGPIVWDFLVSTDRACRLRGWSKSKLGNFVAVEKNHCWLRELSI